MTMASGWAIPWEPRLPRGTAKPYPAHYIAGPDEVPGCVRVLCDEWLRISKPIPAKAENRRCATCAALAGDSETDPRQLTIFDALEAMS